MEKFESYEAPQCESHEIDSEGLVCVSGHEGSGNGYTDYGEIW